MSARRIVLAALLSMSACALAGFALPACGGQVLDVGIAGGAAASSHGADPAIADGVLATQTDDEVATIAADATTLFLGTERGFLYALPKSGGSPTTLVEGNRDMENGQSPILSVTVDADHVYFSARAYTQIARIPKGGGNIEVVADNLYEPGKMAMDATDLYFLVGDEIDPAGAALLRVPKAGGAVETLATGQPALTALVLSDTDVYFTGGSGGPDGVLRRIAKTGGGVQTLASDIDTRGTDNRFGVGSLALVHDEIAFVEPRTGKLSFVPAAGGATRRTAQTSLVDSSLAVNAQSSLVAVSMPDVERIDQPITTSLVRLDAVGAPGTLASWSDERPDLPSDPCPWASVLVDGDQIYWAANDKTAKGLTRWTIRVTTTK